MKTSVGIDYPFEIRPLSKVEGGGYAVTFPDLPGCRSDGETPEQALANGREALADWLAVAREFGDAIAMPAYVPDHQLLPRDRVSRGRDEID